MSSKEKEEICLKIIKGGLYLSLLTPLIVSTKFIFPFVAPKTFFFLGIVELILPFYLYLIISFPQYRPRFNLITKSIFFLLVIMTISSLTGLNFHRSFWSTYERMTGLLTFYHLFILYLILISVIKEKKEWFNLLMVSLGVSVIIGIIALIQKIKPSAILEIPGNRPGSTLGNPTFLAAYLLFNIFFALILASVSSKKWLKIIYLSAFFFLSLILILTATRGAFLAYLFGLVLIGLFLFKSLPVRFKKISLSISLILFILFISLFLFKNSAFIQDNSTLNRLVNISLKESTLKSRILVWQAAFKGWQERPFLGWGWENFNLVFNKHFNPLFFSGKYGDRVWFDRAHNFFFDWLAMTGLIGLISFLSVFLIAFACLWGNYCRNKEKLISSILIIILLTYLIQNLFVFDMIASYLMVFLTLSVVNGFTQKESSLTQEKKPLNNFKNPFFCIICLIVWLIILNQFVIAPLRAGHFLYLGVDKSKTYQDRLENIKKGIKTSSLAHLEGRETLVRFYLEEVLPQAKHFPDKNKLKNDLEKSLEEAKKSIEENPADFRVYYLLARLYNFAVQLNPKYVFEAEKLLKKAYSLSPNNQQWYWEAAQVAFFENKPQEAINFLKKAVDLCPDSSLSHYYLALSYKMTKQDKLAIEEFKKTIVLKYARPSVYLNLIECYRNLGQFSEIIPFYQKLINLQGDKPEFHLGLAQAYIKLGKLDKAKLEIEKVTKFAPMFHQPEFLEKVKDLQNQIKDLETTIYKHLDKKP